MADQNVLHFPAHRNSAVTELSERLRDLVYSYCHRMSVAEAVGALTVLQSEIIENASD